MNLKDVLHLYTGCEINILREDGRTVERIKLNASKLVLIENDYYSGSEKLILRPLSDIKESEVIELMKLSVGDVNVFRADNPNTHKFSATQFVYLLQQSFDLFGLINSGQAI